MYRVRTYLETVFFTGKRRIVLIVLASSMFACAVLFGIALGLNLAATDNVRNMEELTASRPAIPSQLLDINGNLITEFFSDEKRNLIPITAIPENQIYALLTREDGLFYKHTGVSLSGLVRATINNILYFLTDKGYFSGFSTLTMQVAGAKHADRTEISMKRKLKEIWWAYQLERRFTKQEILELYLNSVYFGHNTYGVEAASRFFFGHSATENTPAESVMLVIQLAGSGLYSPIIQPNAAKNKQLEILDQMVSAGHIDPEVAKTSFEDYWNNFDWSRSVIDSPYFDRLANDKAPYFSEFIRNEIEKYLFGQQNIYRDGYTIYTTLNLNYQRKADGHIKEGLQVWNQKYQNERDRKNRYASVNLDDTIELLSLVFDIPGIQSAGSRDERTARKFVINQLTPVTDLMSMVFGLNDLKSVANISYEHVQTYHSMNNVETALITLDNETGYILAMVGGSEFNRNNQFNRAMEANLMPGSAFKPLYYSAAISSGAFTAASRIHDGPRIFVSPDGTAYIPSNYAGTWSGGVLLRDALSKSLNIPALIVLETIGFDAAINRSADLLGITSPQGIATTFDRVYPLGLGTLSISPIQLARAYATIANAGHGVEPIAIRYIEDRDGNIIVNPERELRESQAKKDMQIITPQTAFIITSILQSTVTSGTLAYAKNTANGFDGMPMAGKTGTSQNWEDAWTVGFSPYYTTAIWIGFDKRGNSLGKSQTGATSTGPVWASYMKGIHEGLPKIDFPRPATGIVKVVIDRRTGMLPDEDTPKEQLRSEYFIAGTQPMGISDLAIFEADRDEQQAIKIAIDSSRTNVEIDNPDSAAGTRDLFSELNLEPLYLDGELGIDQEEDELSGGILD